MTNPVPDLESTRRLRERSDLLVAAALRRLDSEMPWYRLLDAQDRSWVSVLAQNGVQSFISWYENPDQPLDAESAIFASAPPELARSISLQSTLQLVRVLVEAVEAHVPQIASPGQESALQEAVLRYSRDVAFSAAEVYARAAEVRGSWDSRLESLIIDAVIRGDSETSLGSRVAALGWRASGNTAVIIGPSPEGITDRRAADSCAEHLRRTARKFVDDALVGVHGDRLVVVVGGAASPREVATDLQSHFGEGHVVVGPSVAGLPDAGYSAKSAMAGLAAVKGWPDAPQVVAADELLPERALLGEPIARAMLVRDVYDPLTKAGGSFLETLRTYLDHGRSLEAAARLLFVHPNTVRYRLRRAAEITGWDAADAREAFVLHIAMTLGQLGAE